MTRTALKLSEQTALRRPISLRAAKKLRFMRRLSHIVSMVFKARTRRTRLASCQFRRNIKKALPTMVMVQTMAKFGS